MSGGGKTDGVTAKLSKRLLATPAHLRGAKMTELIDTLAQRFGGGRMCCQERELLHS